jgi:hypothetical protein
VRYALPGFGGATALLVTHRPLLGAFMAVAATVLVVDDVRRRRRRRRRGPPRHRPVPVVLPPGSVSRPLRAT